MDPYVVGSVVVMASVLGFSYQQGYLSKMRNWINVRHQQVKVMWSLIDKLQHDVSNPAKGTASFTVNDTDQSASILYERMGQQYILMVPYKRKHVSTMTQFKVELLRSGKPALDITQQPGIPYMVSAGDLGGHIIKITNEDNGVTHEYGEEKIPMYGEEVMDQE